MEKKRTTAVSLLVKPVEHAATSNSAQFCLFITEPHSQTVVNLFFVLNNAGMTLKKKTIAFIAVEKLPHKVASQSSQAEVLVELWHAS